MKKTVRKCLHRVEVDYSCFRYVVIRHTLKGMRYSSTCLYVRKSMVLMDQSELAQNSEDFRPYLP